MSITVPELQGKNVGTTVPFWNGHSSRKDKELKVFYQVLSHSSMGSERALKILHLALVVQDGMFGLDSIYHLFPSSIKKEINAALTPNVLDQLLSISRSSSPELYLMGLLNLAQELEFKQPYLALALAKSVTEIGPLVPNQTLYVEQAQHFIKRIHGFGNAGDQFYVGFSQFAYQEPWKALPIYMAGGKAFEMFATKLGAVLPNAVWARLGIYALAQSAEVATVASGQSVVFGTDWWTNLKHNSLALPIFRGVGLATQRVASGLRDTTPLVQTWSLPALAPASQLASLALVHQAEIKLGWRPEAGFGNYAAGVLAEFVPLVAGQKIVEVARRPVALSVLETFQRLQTKFNQLLAKLPMLETSYAWETGVKVKPILAVMMDPATLGSLPQIGGLRAPNEIVWPSRRFTAEQIKAMEGPLKKMNAVRGARMAEAFGELTSHLAILNELIELNVLTPELARNYFQLIDKGIQGWLEFMKSIGNFDAMLRHDLNSVVQGFGFLQLPFPYHAYARDTILSSAAVFKDAVGWFFGKEPLLQPQSSWDRWMHSMMRSDTTQDVTITSRGDFGAVAPGLWWLMIRNLYNNSSRYADRSRKLDIKIEIAPSRFVYEDNAQGIAEVHLDRLFEYGNRAGRNDRNGTGIGTYLIAQVVAAHGGELVISSKPGEGTRYEITLPSHNGTSNSSFH